MAAGAHLVDVAADDVIEVTVVLGTGEEHGRASRDWVYGLLGHRFADTAGERRQVRNFSGKRRLRMPGIGPCWTYRVDLSDQHTLTAELGRPVVSRLGLDSRLMSGLTAGLTWVPGAADLLRWVEPVIPWSRLGSDRWVLAVGSRGRIDRWVTGRDESRGTGVVAGLATLMVLEAPVAGVTHLHQRTSLDALELALRRHDIEVAASSATAAPTVTSNHDARLRG